MRFYKQCDLASDLDIRAAAAERIELLKNRCDLLSGPNRVMLRLFLEGNLNASQLARMVGVSQSTITKRTKKLLGGLDGKYILCLRHQDKLTAEQMVVAQWRFVEKFSIKKIAGLLQCSLYQIRKIVSHLEQFIQTQSARPAGDAA